MRENGNLVLKMVMGYSVGKVTLMRGSSLKV